MKLSQADFRDTIALDLRPGLYKWSDVVRILQHFTISAMVSLAG